MKENNSSAISRMRAPIMHGVLDYRRFFGRPVPIDPIERLKKYPTDVLIIMLAKVNALIFQSGGDMNKIDNDVFSYGFDKLDKSYRQKLIEIRSTESREHSIIFTPQTIVRLMAILIASYRPITAEDSLDQKAEKVMQAELFESILAINDSYYNSIDNDNMLSHELIWKLELLQQPFARGVPKMYGVSSLTIFLFFRFMGDRYGEGILKEFADAFKVASPYQFYFVFLQTITSSFTEYEKDQKPRYCIVDETLEKVLQPFVYDPLEPNQVPISGESFALINQPFYRFSGGIVILDFEFFSHLTDLSLMYHFYKVTSLKEKHGVRNYNEYLGMIGKHFFEEYLALELIRKTFTHRYNKVFTEKDDPGFPDILILQNNKDVFVIEVKSSRVNGSVLDQADTERFEKYLNESFANEKLGTNQKNKGIFQLKNQIQHLKSKGRKLRIFPVIIYTESSMDIAGVNTFLDDKFDTIIAEEKLCFIKIHPLTLINLNFFIKYYPQLKVDRYFLRNKIIEYHARRKSQLKKAFNKGNPWIYFTAEYSFIRFMEQTYPTGDPMNYFKIAASDFAFSDEVKNAPVA